MYLEIYSNGIDLGTVTFLHCLIGASESTKQTHPSISRTNLPLSNSTRFVVYGLEASLLIHPSKFPELPGESRVRHYPY